MAASSNGVGIISNPNPNPSSESIGNNLIRDGEQREGEAVGGAATVICGEGDAAVSSGGEGDGAVSSGGEGDGAVSSGGNGAAGKGDEDGVEGQAHESGDVRGVKEQS